MLVIFIDEDDANAAKLKYHRSHNIGIEMENLYSITNFKNDGQNLFLKLNDLQRLLEAGKKNANDFRGRIIIIKIVEHFFHVKDDVIVEKI